MIRRLAEEMAEKRILPELEAFDAGMINYAKYLTSKGVLQPPHYFNLILGEYRLCPSRSPSRGRDDPGSAV